LTSFFTGPIEVAGDGIVAQALGRGIHKAAEHGLTASWRLPCRKQLPNGDGRDGPTEAEAARRASAPPRVPGSPRPRAPVFSAAARRIRRRASGNGPRNRPRERAWLASVEVRAM